MTTCTLHRIDPARRMARFYAMRVERDLFGSIVLMKEWAVSAGGGAWSASCTRQKHSLRQPCSTKPNGNGGVVISPQSSQRPENRPHGRGGIFRAYPTKITAPLPW